MKKAQNKSQAKTIEQCAESLRVHVPQWHHGSSSIQVHCRELSPACERASAAQEVVQVVQ